VTVPVIGAVGTIGAALRVTEFEEVDVHDPLPTVNVYDPATRPEIVVEVPVPVAVPLGEPVIVQVPEEGSPVNVTLPVLLAQSG
jgi:hypothetical protein